MNLSALASDYSLNAEAPAKAPAIVSLTAYYLTDPQGNRLTDPQGNYLVGYFDTAPTPVLLSANPSDYTLNAE